MFKNIRLTIPLITTLLFLTALIWNGCKHEPIEPEGVPDPEACDTSNVTFTGSVLPVFEANCLGCHSGSQPGGGLDFTNFDHVAIVAQNGALLGALKHETGYSPMPKNAEQLDDCTIKKIEIWIRDTTFSDPGNGNEHPCDPDSVYFRNQIQPLINSTCATVGCHDHLDDEQEVILTDYAAIISYGEIIPGDPENSKLFEKITEDDPDDRMPPPPAEPLTAQEISLIRTWIGQGAKDNHCEEDCDTTNVSFSGSIWPTIELNCVGCHSGAQPAGEIRLEDYQSVAVMANNGRLFGAISHAAGFEPMPRNAPKLSDCKIEQFKIWIEDGTPNN